MDDLKIDLSPEEQAEIERLAKEGIAQIASERAANPTPGQPVLEAALAQAQKDQQAQQALLEGVRETLEKHLGDYLSPVFQVRVLAMALTTQVHKETGEKRDTADILVNLHAVVPDFAALTGGLDATN